MSKLTKRSLLLTVGYGSEHKKNDIIQKLGTIEHRSERLAEEICAKVCRHVLEAESQDEMDICCSACPLTQLMALID